MKPAAGTYRLMTAGAPSMDFQVNADGSAKSTLDTWAWDEERGWFVAQHHACVVRCTGSGTFEAFVGVAPGFGVSGICAAT